MKKLLLFVLGFMAVFMGCKDEEKEDSFIYHMSSSTPFYSKDSIHYYHGMSTLCKVKKEISNDYSVSGPIVWEKPLVKPAPFVIDLGYGSKDIREYEVFSIIDTDENIFVFWNIYSSSFNANPTHPVYIGKYSLSGDFIGNTSLEIDHGFLERGRLVDMSAEAIFVILSCKDVEYLFTIDKSTGDIIDVYYDTENKFEFFTWHDRYSFIQFIKNRIIAVYGGLHGVSLKLYDWDKKKQIGVDVESFVNQKYPNEERAPQYSTSHEVITETYADFTLHITFYNGTKVEHRLRFDYEAQEIIELML